MLIIFGVFAFAVAAWWLAGAIWEWFAAPESDRRQSPGDTDYDPYS